MDLGPLKKDIVFPAKLRDFDLYFCSTWGLFSPRSIDEGTHLLIDQLEINEGDTCLDIGCGYGAVGCREQGVCIWSTKILWLSSTRK
jgi:16S rRNA G1207 methylase RsmC